MAYLTGLKKQINKANQFMSEKISGVEGTKLDDDFHTMERKTDLFVELVDDLQIKTKEFLQPNPTVRAKMAAVKGISKLSGQAKASTYPQPEGTLGEAMLTYGNKLLDFDRDSVYASSLIESGEALKGMADLKYALDDNVKQNYLEPLHHLQTKDLKEVAHHRKKLQGRKLDYDCKKRKQQSGGAVPELELKQAEDKFAESLNLAQMGMHNIMEADEEQISQLMQFAEALMEYHKHCSEILQGLTDTLYTKAQAASGRQRREFTPKTLEDLGVETNSDYNFTAPIKERAIRASSSGRSDQRSSSIARSSSNSSASVEQPRPTSQPNFSTALLDLDPWDKVEQLGTVQTANPSSSGREAHNAPSAFTGWGGEVHIPPSTNTAWGREVLTGSSASVGWSAFPESTSSGSDGHQATSTSTGWNVFPETPAPAPRAAWGEVSAKQNCNFNNNVVSSHNSGYEFQKSNIPIGGLIHTSPVGSTAGTPTHRSESPFSSGFNSGEPSPLRYTPTRTAKSQPSCQALYDFEAENSDELGFKEGDVISLKQKVDDNWFEGTFQGRTGFFPINYVTVLVPLP